MIGFHSVIERPLSVSRVIPPTTIIRKTSVATTSSQLAIDSGRVGGCERSLMRDEATAESISPAPYGGAYLKDKFSLKRLYVML